MSTARLGHGNSLMLGKVHSQSYAFSQRWIPLLLGVVFGVFAARLIASEAWHFLVPLVLAVPVIVLFTRYPFAAILIWLLVFPYFAEGSDAAMRYVYWIVHRAMIPGVLGITILWKLTLKKKEPGKLGLPELALGGFLLLAVINIILLSYKPLASLIYLYDRSFVPFCAYMLIRLTAPKETDLRHLLPVAFLTIPLQFAVSLLSWFKPQLLPAVWLELPPGRTSGTFGDIAIYTSTLIFLSLLLFQYAKHCARRWLRFALFSVVLVAFFGVFFSFSRGSWLGGLLVLVGLGVLYPKTTVRSAMVLAIVVLILGTTVFQKEMTWASERLESRQSAESRIPQYVAALRMIGEKPLFGWGSDNYNYEVRQFTTHVGDIRYTKIHSSHNSTLTILVEMGIIGFFFSAFPVAWWLMWTIKNWQRLPRDGLWSRQLVVMLWLSMLNLLVVSCFHDIVSTENPFGLTLFWITVGFISNMVGPHLGPAQWRPRLGGVKF